MTNTRLIIALVAIAALSAPACADDDLAEGIDISIQAAAYGMPVVRLLDSDPVKRETGRRMADALIINAAATALLNEVITSTTPDGEDDGFPSGHTSTAFAIAMALSEREADLKWVALPLAAAAGWARVDQDEHTWWQVIGGAALGTWVGHMCGEGRWRIFGDRDAVSTFAQQAPVMPAVAPVHTTPRRQMAWQTTLWDTTF